MPTNRSKPAYRVLVLNQNDEWRQDGNGNLSPERALEVAAECLKRGWTNVRIQIDNINDIIQEAGGRT